MPCSPTVWLFPVRGTFCVCFFYFVFFHIRGSDVHIRTRLVDTHVTTRYNGFPCVDVYLQRDGTCYREFLTLDGQNRLAGSVVRPWVVSSEMADTQAIEISAVFVGQEVSVIWLSTVSPEVGLRLRGSKRT